MDAYVDGRSNILSPSTISLYKLLRRTAYPSIVDVKIGKITQPMIQSSINEGLIVISNYFVLHEGEERCDREGHAVFPFFVGLS